MIQSEDPYRIFDNSSMALSISCDEKRGLIFDHLSDRTSNSTFIQPKRDDDKASEVIHLNY